MFPGSHDDICHTVFWTPSGRVALGYPEPGAFLESVSLWGLANSPAGCQEVGQRPLDPWDLALQGTAPLLPSLEGSISVGKTLSFHLSL